TAAPARATRRAGPDRQEFCAGSKISTLSVIPPLVRPPATITEPSGNRAQAWLLRGSIMGAAGTKRPSTPKNSDDESAPCPATPPVIRTRPSASSTEQALLRGDCIRP